MSFVSIVAHKSWISIVSDGRCMSGNEILAEDHQKFVRPAKNRITAYAGDKDRCELVIRGMKELGHNQRDLVESAKHMAGLIQELGRRGFKLFMATGGLGPNGAEVYGFSTESQQPTILKPDAMGLQFMFLSNHGVSEESLNIEFANLVKKHGYNDPIKVQKPKLTSTRGLRSVINL